MNEHDDIRAQLEKYVLGELSPAEFSVVAGHLRACALCQGEVRSVEVALLALVAQSPVERMRERLTTALTGAARFEHLVDPTASLFDLSPAEVRALFARLDVADAWHDGPADGVKLLPVTPGPAARESLSALVRVEPNATFPEHEHLGEERVLVLEGGYRSEGQEYWRGDLDVRAVKTRHSFTALEGPPCLCASVIFLPKA